MNEVDRLRAELAAANARNAKLEERCELQKGGVAQMNVAAWSSALNEARTERDEWRRHYEDTYKAYTNAKTNRHSSCIALEQRRIAERDALQARLDQVKALVDTWEVAPISSLDELRAVLNEGATP